MIYLIIDVHYTEVDTTATIATVAGIRFTGIEQNHILSKHKIQVDHVEPYQSGQFYKREMPCILKLLQQISEPYDIIIIDGYVYLDGKSQEGLGKYLYDNLQDKKPVIGIAKNKFHAITDDYAIYRGTSKKPLYVTAIEIATPQALAMVQKLAGNHRLPNVITMVDHLSRGY